MNRNDLQAMLYYSNAVALLHNLIWHEADKYNAKGA